MERLKILFFSFLLTAMSVALSQPKEPSFEEVLSLRSAYGPVLSPDGKSVVFNVASTDWKKNRYDREIWISKNLSTPFQLTNNKEGNSSSPKWSPDGNWIAFLSDRGDKNQIYVINVNGGEPFRISTTNESISSFEWSPDGKQIAYLQSESKKDEQDQREKKYGKFEEDEAEYALRRLWLMAFDPTRLGAYQTPEVLEDSLYKASLKATPLMDSVDFTIMSYRWSPDGKKIAFGMAPNPLINSFFDADIAVYDLETAEYSVLVNNESFDGLEDWSPDSQSIIYSTDLEDRSSNYYKNGHLFRINVDGTNKVKLAADFDEYINAIQWSPTGIYGYAWQKTERTFVKIDENSGAVTRLEDNFDRVASLDISKDGKTMTFTAQNQNSLADLYVSDTRLKKPVKLFAMTDQIKNWKVSDSEVISWKSKDGATIEGVLHKPMDYDPSRKYPLLVAIHGGPTGISTPSPVSTYVYPVVNWLNKGALVLMPNYRGSAGYGEEFRSLNVKNLGVGDAWDVLSGVEYLEQQGMIDPDKVGCMGWSQGGYISAFLTTNSDKFKAISVGAGISNWMTYYVNTDIHPFTRQYLKATPWSDKEIYEKTSPMTNINNASTPTLIQHGEFDRRVPIANGYELVQGLRDVGVPTKLIVYKGFGHGITKPKERLAAVWHNWQWFARYIWDEDVELPE